MAIPVPERFKARNRVIDPLGIDDPISWLRTYGNASSDSNSDYFWQTLVVSEGSEHRFGPKVEYVTATERIYVSMKVMVSTPVENVSLVIRNSAGLPIAQGNQTFSLTPFEWTELRDSVTIPEETPNGSAFLAVQILDHMEQGSSISVREVIGVGEVITPFFFGGTPPFKFQGQLVKPYFDFSTGTAYSQFDYYDVQGEPPSVDWSSNASRKFVIGADRGMLYRNNYGYAWPGLISVDRSASDDASEKRYLDGNLIDVAVPTPDYSATLEVYTYPEEFEPCIGIVTLGSASLRAYGQEAERFSFCYRTFIGDGNDPKSSYRLHFVYDAIAEDQGHVSSTMSDSSEGDSFKFKIYAIPRSTPGLKPTSYFTVDSKNAEWLMVGLERVLYGHLESAPRLPTIDEIKTYLQT